LVASSDLFFSSMIFLSPNLPRHTASLSPALSRSLSLSLSLYSRKRYRCQGESAIWDWSIWSYREGWWERRLSPHAARPNSRSQHAPMHQSSHQPLQPSNHHSSPSSTPRASLATRLSTTRSSKVILPYAIKFRALCGANLVPDLTPIKYSPRFRI